MFAFVFAPQPVRDFQDSLKIDAKRFAQFFHYLLERGVYLPPSSVDAACVSAAHTPQDIETTVDIIAAALLA
jgi:glutamate-1-semialdehyde 2,1-aminomutase